MKGDIFLMQRRAFVLMPFEDEFDDIYEYLIREPLSNAGYDVNRADEILDQENILASIIDSIVNSELIVADLSTSNPNVYYELGLAHVYRKNVVLLTQEITEVPFDLRSYRIIKYGTQFAQMEQGLQDFKKLIKEIQSGTTKFGSPITDFGPSTPSPILSNTQVSVLDNQDERGIIDFRIAHDENMEIMTNIVTEVGERIGGVKTEMEIMHEKIKNPEELSAKEVRKIMHPVANNMKDYASWLKGGNSEYRNALMNVEENLDAMLSVEFVDLDKDRESIRELIYTIKNVEDETREARAVFSETVELINAIPRVEKEFNRSKRLMSNEIKIFVDNIEQTISVLVRARHKAINILGDDDQVL